MSKKKMTFKLLIKKPKSRIPIPPPNKRHKSKKDYDRRSLKKADRMKIGFDD